MTSRPTQFEDGRAKVTNIGDRRNFQRIVEIVNLSLADADIVLSADERRALWSALQHQYSQSGYILGRA